MGNDERSQEIGLLAVGRNGLAVLMSIILGATPAIADGRLPSRQEQLGAIVGMYPKAGAGCKSSIVTAYNMRGFWFPASVRVCQDSIEDVSAGPYAPSSGERFFYIDGRGFAGSLYALTRGTPNTPYEFTRNDGDEEVVHNGYKPNHRTSWNDTISALPFVPYSTMTYDHDGYTSYAYSDLKILPGRESAAYPITRESIIISIDGYQFPTPDGIIGMLSDDSGSDTPYVEITYVQRNERPQVARRAFIPRLSMSTDGAAWRAMTASSRVGKIDSSGHVVAQVAAVFAFLALVYGFERSGIADAFRDQRDECRKRQAAMGGANVIC